MFVPMNDCECHLFIRGAEERREQLLQRCAGIGWDDKAIALDFEKIFPSPVYLRENAMLLEDWRLMRWEVPAVPASWSNYHASANEPEPGLTKIVLLTGDRPPLPVIDKLAAANPD